MNYDSITGLPLEASFLAYTEYSCEHQDGFPFYILAINFPILKHEDFLANSRNKNFLLSSAVHKLIRNHNYMKTAYRKEDDDTLLILLDDKLMSNHDINEELQKAFICFTSYCSSSFIETPVHIHAGIYHIADNEVSVTKAIANAIEAMNSISPNDQTTYKFFRESEAEQQKVESRILPAIEDNWKNNHLLIYLQPKFDLKSQTMAGAEALVRIIDTKGHMVKPGFFLPILQRHNMSCEMDLMVIEKILRLLDNWNSFGIAPIPISVNLSENSLYHPMFTSIFEELMAKFSEIQRYLRIEISEHAYLRNPYHVNQMIDFFHSYGCMIELDDFGKNLMSYTTSTLPHVDFVKLSSAFWSMAMQNENQNDSFDDYISVLKECNVSCISECIEHEDELDFLKSHNIPYAQGFYFSRPVPFDIFQKKYLSYTFVSNY